MCISNLDAMNEDVSFLEPPGFQDTENSVSPMLIVLIYSYH